MNVPTRKEVLESPCTHYMVGKVFAITDKCDPVDALYDLELIVAVLKKELAR